MGIEVSKKIIDCVVVGGSGHVGGLFIDCLASSGFRVTCVDTVSCSRSVAFVRGDITVPCREVATAIGQADAVVLAVSERVALAAINPLTSMMRRGALLVDTLSVKSGIIEAMRLFAGPIEILSLNPMFSPSLGMRGRPIAAIRLKAGVLAREFEAIIESWGARLIFIDPDQHDRLTAVTQAATHAAILAFGLTVSNWGVKIADLLAIAPPPHLTLLAMLARIASQTPEVYWDVQFGNPEAKAARRMLGLEIARVDDAANDGPAFALIIDRLRAFLGHDCDCLANACAELYATLPKALKQNNEIAQSETSNDPKLNS